MVSLFQRYVCLFLVFEGKKSIRHNGFWLDLLGVLGKVWLFCLLARYLWIPKACFGNKERTHLLVQCWFCLNVRALLYTEPGLMVKCYKRDKSTLTLMGAQPGCC